MSKMKALVCRECGKEYPPKAIHVCEMCFGPLEVAYDHTALDAPDVPIPATTQPAAPESTTI